MKVVTLKSVLDRIAGYLGEARGLDTNDAALATMKVNFFMRLAWLHFWWPELMKIEARALRNFYATGLFVQAGDELYHVASQQYYQALQAQPDATQAPATSTDGGKTWVENSAWWAQSKANYGADLWVDAHDYVVGDQALNPDNGETYQCITDHTSSGTMDLTQFAILTPFRPILAYEQTDKTIIGDVRYVHSLDPQVYPSLALRYPFTLRDTGVQIQINLPVDLTQTSPVTPTKPIVWVEHRPPLYPFTILAWVEGTFYDKGDVRYYQGDCYRSLSGNNDSTPSGLAQWELVPMPEMFAEYAAQSAYAMLTNREQQIPEDFSLQDAAGYPLLLVELDRIERQQGQTRQLNVQSARMN
jgi:hypothetical protein